MIQLSQAPFLTRYLTDKIEFVSLEAEAQTRG